MGKFKVFLASACFTSFFASAASADQLFFDSFESGDMSASNADGFSWGANNRTSVVTSDTVVYDNGYVNITPNDDRDWTPIHGDHALRFRYPSGETMAEQRFDLGDGYESLWIRYWVRVPTNFSHGENNGNNKFFAIWMDGYSANGSGATVFWNFWGDTEGGSSITVAYNEGDFAATGAQLQRTKFIQVPSDRGRWMQVVINVKAASSTNTSDGYIGFWRRWEKEDSFTQIHEVNNVNLQKPDQQPKGWKSGYLMGWANAPYEVQTEWLVDQFELSTNSLLTSTAENAPNPPNLIQVE